MSLANRKRMDSPLAMIRNRKKMENPGDVIAGNYLQKTETDGRYGKQTWVLIANEAGEQIAVKETASIAGMIYEENALYAFVYLGDKESDVKGRAPMKDIAVYPIESWDEAEEIEQEATAEYAATLEAKAKEAKARATERAAKKAKKK